MVEGESLVDNPIDALDSLVSDAVKSHLQADVEVGAFLSGGIDSSLISAIAAKNYHKKLHTFTVGFEDPAFDESHFARNIAGYLNTEHHEMIISGKDMISAFEKMYSIYDEPFGDLSAIPSIIVSEFASRHVKYVYQVMAEMNFF